MSLLSKYVEITPNAKNYKHYMALGYEIPKRIDKQNVVRIDSNKKIIVNVKDLQKGCAAMVDVKCDSCGKEYSTHYSAYYKCKHDDKSYCLQCAKKIFKTPQKTNSIIRQKKDYRYNHEYRKFTQDVLFRDKRTCQCCGKQEKLVVHHLNGYDWYIEGRTLTDNAITLCEDCHISFHSIYGKGGNTKEQFYEWFNNINIDYIKNNRKGSKSDYVHKRRIYCITTNKIFDSFRDAASCYNILQQDNIRVCCEGRSKSAGKLKDGTKLKWMYYQDYLNKNVS